MTHVAQRQDLVNGMTMTIFAWNHDYNESISALVKAFLATLGVTQGYHEELNGNQVEQII